MNQQAVTWIFAIGLLCAANACTHMSDKEYRGITSGVVGCPEEEIELAGHQNTVMSHEPIVWRATCRGRVFLCSGGDGFRCREELSARAGAPRKARSEPSADGCSYDTQCKGDRICSEGKCVGPQ